MNERNWILDGIYREQPPEVQSAIDELEARGLRWCIHFGTENAVVLLADMNRAFDMGCLYEWMARHLGVVTE